MSILSWGSQSSSLRRHTLQKSTPTTPPQQAEREGFGQGQPVLDTFRPRRFSRPRRLTPPGRCEHLAARSRPWDSSRFRPVPVFAHAVSSTRSHRTHPHRSLDTSVTSASRQATRGHDLSSHLHVRSVSEETRPSCWRVSSLHAHRLSPARRAASRRSRPVCPRLRVSSQRRAHLLRHGVSYPDFLGFAATPVRAAPRRRTGGRSRRNPSSPRAPHPWCGSGFLHSLRSPASSFARCGCPPRAARSGFPARAA